METTDRYPIPASFARAEIRVVNSRFIGSADYTPTVEAAKAFIAQIRDEFPDATHHAYAYVVGYGASVTAGMSDDGEPSGTAGRPMLSIVRGSGLGDVTAVATRFFGGTLLGTGGLVHAYSDTTRAVLDVLPITERVEKCTLSIHVDYAVYNTVRRALEQFETTFVREDFAAAVTIVINLPVADYEHCTATLATLTSGQAEIVVQEE